MNACNNFMDNLAVFTAFLQILDYMATMEQSTNDDVIEELHRQTSEHLKRIEAQNEEILKLLRDN